MSKHNAYCGHVDIALLFTIHWLSARITLSLQFTVCLLVRTTGLVLDRIIAPVCVGGVDLVVQIVSIM